MSRGFLDDIGGSKRLRMAVAGANARDFSLPMNKVAFDSDWLGAAGIAYTGTFQLTADITTRTTMVTYADLGAKPMAEVAFMTPTGFYTNLGDSDFGTTTNLDIYCSATDISVLVKNGNYPLTVSYVIYRIFPT